MDQHPNAKRMVEAMSAFNARDFDEVLSRWTEVPLFHVPARGPRGGDAKGREELAQLMGDLVKLSSDTTKLDLIDILADDNYGVAVLRMVGSRDDFEADFTIAYAVKFDSEGRQAEAWLLASDRVAYDKLLA